MRKLSPIQRAYVAHLKKIKAESPSIFERDKTIVMDNIWQLKEVEV